jgi:hypothetical protein
MLLVIGLITIYAAFWVGPLGVLDLYEYAENAEHLWLDLRWDMHRTDPGIPTYSRFAMGLPIVSGPFVYAGQALEWLSQGAIGRRWVMATISPLAMVAACLVLERIALLLGYGWAASRWAAVMLGLSAAALFYTRFLFVEPVLGLFALASLYAFLRASEDAQRRRWLAWCGVFCASALLCHYAYLFLIAGLGIVYAMATYRQARPGRWQGDLTALAMAPLIAGALILGMSWHQYGNPLHTGYSDYEPLSSILGHVRFRRNATALGITLLGAPWLVAVLVVLWRARIEHPPWRWCALAVLAGLVLQQSFWLAFKYYCWSPLRYDVALVMVAAIGLPACAVYLARRWPRRGLAYATLVMLVCATGSFLGGNNDFHKPFVNDPEDILFPDQVTTATWYADRGPYHVRPDYMISADGYDMTFVYPLSPVRWPQWATLATLVSVGGLLLWLSFSAARSGAPGPAGSPAAALPPDAI